MSVFKVGDRVTHVNQQVTWLGLIIATPQSHYWDCVPGTVRVQRYTIDAEGVGVLIPSRLLQLEPQTPEAA